MTSLHQLDQRLLDQRLTPMSPIAGTATLPRYNTQIMSRFGGVSDVEALVRARSDLEQPAKCNKFWDADLQSYMYLEDFLMSHPNWKNEVIRYMADKLASTSNLECESHYEKFLPQYMSKADLAKQIEEILDLAPEREERFMEIIDQDDADGAVNYWLGMLRINPARHPATYLMVRLGRRIGEHVAMCLKGYFRSPRPSQLCPTIVPMIDPPGTPSFPAGHAVQAYLMSYLLAYSLPNIPPGYNEMALQSADGPLFKLAYRVSQNRIVAGVHYPIDIKAGRIVAIKCFELVQSVYSMWGNAGQQTRLTYDRSLEKKSLRQRVREELPQYA